MKKTILEKVSKSLFFIPAIVIFGMLITSLFSYRTTVNNTSEHAERILLDSAREQSAILKTKLQDELDKLSMLATFMSSGRSINIELLSERLEQTSKRTLYSSLGYATRNGLAIMSNGQLIDISDRSYFQKCLGGQRVIDWLPHSRSDGLAHFVFAAPITRNRQIWGIIVAEYNQKDLQNLLISQAYNAQGYSFVTTDTGQILIADEKSALHASIDNLFYELKNNSDIAPKDLKKLQKSLQSGERDSISLHLRNEDIFAIYEPLNISNWYIFNVVPKALITREIYSATKTNLFHFVIAIFLALFSCLALIYSEKQANKRLAVEAEKQRLTKESYLIAVKQSSKKLIRYNPLTDRALPDLEEESTPLLNLLVTDGPSGLLDANLIAQESKGDFRDFFQSIKIGVSPVSTRIRMNEQDNPSLWLQLDSTTIFNDEGLPQQAIISYFDISEQRKKEIAYEKWKRESSATSTQGIASYEWNLNQGILETSTRTVPSTESYKNHVKTLGFNERAKYHAEQIVVPEDRQKFLDFLNRERLIGSYHDGQMSGSMEYRIITGADTYNWTRLSFQLVPYPDNDDIKAYILFRDIDKEKRAELELKDRSEKDPLTGTLNRSAIVAKINDLLEHSSSTAQHGFIMLDIDNFKLVNDTYGHSEGDNTLNDFTCRLHGILRSDDLLSRIGGDEFFICLKDVPYDGVIKKKAQQICDLLQKEFPSKLHISTSIGIAVFPRDGKTFEELYRNADSALYQAKENGKAGYCFYNSLLSGKASGNINQTKTSLSSSVAKKKMLIVDDEKVNLLLLSNMFDSEFEIHTAENGNDALGIMRRFGAGINIVLLDLIMPDMDGFAILSNMKRNQELRNVPVVVVSGSEDINISLKAIKAGASDYVSKPVNANLIKLRVASALAKIENERLLAQFSYLRLQSDEEARYRTVLESTGTIVLEHDWINQLFVYDSDTGKHLAGTYDNNISLWDIFATSEVASTHDIEAMKNLVAQIANNKEINCGTMTVQLKSACGEHNWYRMNIFQVTDEFRTINKLIITLNNINEEYIANEKLHFQAERDPLTKLLNRPTFIAQAEKLLRQSPPFSYVLSYCDIDNFKIVNDLYGHAFGDKLLKDFANIINTSMSAVQGLAGRISGDCFIMLYPSSEQQLEKELSSLSDKFKKLPGTSAVNLSIGRYLIDNPLLPVDTLMDRAALAQKTIKGFYNTHIASYDEALSKRFLWEQEIISSMESALKENQFLVYYQPQYNHNNGAIFGVEALVRWQHPKYGLISPADFIPIFEKNGFIAKLDEYVWSIAAQDLRHWMDKGIKIVPMSVNVSRIDLFNPDLCDILLRIVNENKLPFDFFRLEITESAYVTNTQQLITLVKKLQTLGFIIEMDDFGSGYSSLNLLKDAPVDVIKLDMRFLMGQDPLQRGGSILNSVVRMSKWMNLPVIAEGVETIEQADFLKSIGCNIVQGYLYARPMSSAEFTDTLQKANVDINAKNFFNNTEWNCYNFWNSSSAETILFSNYINAAAIYEYHNDKVELLKLNDRYKSVLQIDDDEIEQLHKTGFCNTVAEDIPRILETASEAIRTGKDGIVDFRRKLIKQGNKLIWLRMNCRILLSNAERTIFLIFLHDVTELYDLREEISRLKNDCITTANKKE